MSGVQDPVKGLMVFRGQKPFSDWHSLQSVVSCCVVMCWLVLLVLVAPLVATSRITSDTINLGSLTVCYWRELTRCCPYYYTHFIYYAGVGRRRWPLLSNAGMSQQELQEAGEERRARRERFRDRQMERDTRRLP
nr:uncharacterized protein LOC128696567 isoform X1 [Cherax quadricarinatus]